MRPVRKKVEVEVKPIDSDHHVAVSWRWEGIEDVIVFGPRGSNPKLIVEVEILDPCEVAP